MRSMRSTWYGTSYLVDNTSGTQLRSHEREKSLEIETVGKKALEGTETREREREREMKRLTRESASAYRAQNHLEARLAYPCYSMLAYE